MAQVRKSRHPTEADLAESVLLRSICRVQVGAVIADKHGSVIAYGWNHVGDGYGCHAEEHAIQRASWADLRGTRIYVAGWRPRSNSYVPARPCDHCMQWIRSHGIATVFYRDKNGWTHFKVGDAD